jgi:hypothetical protein
MGRNPQLEAQPQCGDSAVAGILARQGTEPAAGVVGEKMGTIRNLLLFAGYDLDRLTQGVPTERFTYAMSATQELFADVYQEYGFQSKGDSKPL